MTEGLPFCTVERGPLLFALALETTSHIATAPAFNYALLCDSETMTVESRPLQTSSLDQPFDWPLEAAIKITAIAAQFTWPVFFFFKIEVSRFCF